MLKEVVSKEAQDTEAQDVGNGWQRLVDMGCMVNEREFEIPDELAERLKMK